MREREREGDKEEKKGERAEESGMAAWLTRRRRRVATL